MYIGDENGKQCVIRGGAMVSVLFIWHSSGDNLAQFAGCSANLAQGTHVAAIWHRAKIAPCFQISCGSLTEAADERLCRVNNGLDAYLQSNNAERIVE